MLKITEFSEVIESVDVDMAEEFDVVHIGFNTRSSLVAGYMFS